MDKPEVVELKTRPLGLFKFEMGSESDYDWSEPMSEEELALWEAPIVSTWKNNNGDPRTRSEAPSRHARAALEHVQQSTA